MNIIKLKDVILTPELSGLSQEICDLFNSRFKGRYCWWVRCNYCVPFEDMDTALYVDCEQNGIEVYDGDFLLFTDLTPYVDDATTDAINSITKYDFFNHYALDEDITLDMLRRFRTWLAEQLDGPWHGLVDHYFGSDAPKVRSMLNYYKNEMSDDVTALLATFVDTTLTYTTYPNGGSGCGCTSTGTNGGIPISTVRVAQNLSGLIPVTLGKDCGCQQGFSIGGNTSINNCDPVAIYRNAMYRYMVQTFSDIEFWVALSKDDVSGEDNLIVLFKRYVDGIVQQNLPLTTSTPMQFDDCQCLNTTDKEQQRAMDMLRALSTALSYIIEDATNETYGYSNGEVTVTTSLGGHKNFIATTFNNWATYLYEVMRW